MKPKIYPDNQSIANLKIVKFGIDPTFNRLHVGHLVLLAWLKKQEKKDVTIVLGIHTAQLGDPSGQDETRPMLESKLVLQNAKEIEKQVKKIIPWVRVVYQDLPDTDWLLRTASHITVNKAMSRHGFAERQSVSLHELLVPIIQAMDSVLIGAELEIGGEDQLFNFQLTREVQEIHGQKPETCLMFPILRGTDGQKMSKSKRNCTWLDDPQIGKRIMSISDDVMDEWLPWFAEEPYPEHPMRRKEFLAETIAGML